MQQKLRLGISIVHTLSLEDSSKGWIILSHCDPFTADQQYDGTIFYGKTFKNDIKLCLYGEETKLPTEKSESTNTSIQC